jgi:hypothetical protein
MKLAIIKLFTKYKKEVYRAEFVVRNLEPAKDGIV